MNEHFEQLKLVKFLSTPRLSQVQNFYEPLLVSRDEERLGDLRKGNYGHVTSFFPPVCFSFLCPPETYHHRVTSSPANAIHGGQSCNSFIGEYAPGPSKAESSSRLAP